MTRGQALGLTCLLGTLVIAGCDLLQQEPVDPSDEVATLTVTVEGEGAVSSAPPGIDCPGDCEAEFEVGTSVELNASAESGWEFDHWEGACDGADASCELSLAADATATAVFVELDPGEPVTIEATIVPNPDDSTGFSSNDAQEFEDFVNPSYPEGATWIYNHNNNLAYDNHYDTPIITGLRFVDLEIPQGSVISSATVQFTAASPRSTGTTRAEGSNSVSTSLVIRGEAVDNAEAFVDQEVHNISNRSVTEAAVAWDDVPEWETDAAGPEQRTPDVRRIVQEVVNRDGWAPGNAMVFMVSGDGQRVAYAYRESPDDVPVLTVEFEPPAGGGP